MWLSSVTIFRIILLCQISPRENQMNRRKLDTEALLRDCQQTIRIQRQWSDSEAEWLRAWSLNPDSGFRSQFRYLLAV